MRYQLLGQSGLRVSELCLGTMTFGDVLGWGGNLDACRRMFETCLQAGAICVHPANNYSLGIREQCLGALIVPHRNKLVVATKATMTGVRDDPNAGGNHR